ncbi:hypothetical protein HOS55_gp111 [Pseudomonas phage PMBT3]|uniref:Uncharacterized protein n=1 Tax=Pseudomonas phage PMBT3 TaxID=2059856 RepID=A0A2I6PI34_9CAUD|nr:hypothetical protein HOS55_gp111 [Pseudomonas phage PMBT3]AUM59713.1 hypothetical protein [Pseudomonas phage PMBT3]
MDHPERATRKRKPKPNAQTSSPPTLPISPSLAAQPTVAPGAIPDAGTGTELEALRRTQEEKAPVAIEADGVTSQTLARRLGARQPEKVYDATLANGDETKMTIEKEGLTIVDPMNSTSHELDKDTGTLAKVVDKFNGVPMTEIEIPRAAAMDSPAPVVGGVGALQLSDAEAYAVKQADVVAQDQAVVDAQDAASAAEPLGEPLRTTRLKMTLQALSDIPGDADNPLTRCTFGAVYSPNPTEEDGVFGKYTPFGQLTYNVRSDIAEGLEVGQAYYVDITKVPS